MQFENDRNATFHPGEVTDRATAAAFHHTDRELASWSCDNTAKVWDLETGQELETLVGHIGNVTCLAYSGNGAPLATASGHRYAREVQLWETATFGKSTSLVPAGRTNTILRWPPPPARPARRFTTTSRVALVGPGRNGG